MHDSLSEYPQDPGPRHGELRSVGSPQRRFLRVRHGRLAEEQPPEARICARRLVRHPARQQREAHQRAVLRHDAAESRAGKRQAEDFGPLQDGARLGAPERRGRRSDQGRRRRNSRHRRPLAADRRSGQAPLLDRQSVLRRGRAVRPDEQRHQRALRLAARPDHGRPRLLPRSRERVDPHRLQGVSGQNLPAVGRSRGRHRQGRRRRAVDRNEAGREKLVERRTAQHPRHVQPHEEGRFREGLRCHRLGRVL